MAIDPKQPLLSPWREFLTELDSKLAEPLALHCIGGFVLSLFYGVGRSTSDIDYYTAVPANLNLDEVAGERSVLAKKYKVRLHRVTVTNLPEDYETRLAEMVPSQFKSLKLLVPDPYDCILSKLERNSSKDRDDAEHLFKAQKLDSQRLQERYAKELRPYLANVTRHDLTLKLWIEIFES
jgi:Nucleotidyltransferase of unknown function (DUF6036)